MYLWIALAISVIMTVFAVAFRTMVKADWVAVAMWVVMNLLWAVGYGVYLPRIFSPVQRYQFKAEYLLQNIIYNYVNIVFFKSSFDKRGLFI